MMVAKPEQWIKPMAEAGASIYTFHLEATNNPQQVIKEVPWYLCRIYYNYFTISTKSEVLKY